MESLFSNVGAKLKAFAKIYFQISLWILIAGGSIAFFVLVASEDTAAWGFGILIGVPLLILSNLVGCWVLYAFGTIAEKHEDVWPNTKSVPNVVERNQPKSPAHTSVASTPAPMQTSAPAQPAKPAEPIKPAAPAVDITPYVGKKFCSGCSELITDPNVTECPVCGSKYLGVITRTNAANIIPNIVTH